MKKSYLLILFVALQLILSAAPLRIFHTNDSHAFYQPSAYGVGGYLALEKKLNELRSEDIPSLYLDAGDMQTGSIFSSTEYEGLQGGAVLEVFGRLELDAATLGNHEFDVSYSHAKALVNKAPFPFLSANLLDQEGQSFGRKPYEIFERGGLKIGVIGLTLVELPEKVKTENVQDITILPYLEALEPILPEIRKTSDLVILLTHNGFEADSLLAAQLEGGVDMIIGGHSHIAIDEPYQVNGVYILSTGSHLQALGVVDLDIEAGKIKSFSSRLEPLYAVATDYQSALKDFMDETIGEIEARLSEVAGYLPFDFEVDKYQVTAGSQWIARAFARAYPQADFSLLNNGGLRKRLPQGAVSLRDLHEYIPFGNTVVFFECSGAEILKALNMNIQNSLAKPYDIMSASIAGWESADAKSLKIKGESIRPDKIYRVVSHDYILSQWDKYLGFEPQNAIDTGELFLDAIIRQVKMLERPAASGF